RARERARGARGFMARRARLCERDPECTLPISARHSRLVSDTLAVPKVAGRIRPTRERLPARFFFLMFPRPPRSTLFPYTTLFRSWPLSFLLRERPGGRCAMYNPRDMRLKTNGFRSIALIAAGSPLRGLCAVGCLILGASLAAQQPAPARPDGAVQEKPTFKVQVDLVTNDVIVRDEKGNFIPDLKKEDFEVFEDGVKQDIASMTVVTG